LPNYAEVKYLGNIALRRMTGITKDGVVMALVRNVEGHIRVPTSTQEHKNFPFNTTANVILKFVPVRCE
jgi:hypothetical protein